MDEAARSEVFCGWGFGLFLPTGQVEALDLDGTLVDSSRPIWGRKAWLKC